ncbi:MAG TPA: iron ABC transporter permease [bacterium]|nr:iron ABC transporter permease [bacterium]
MIHSHHPGRVLLFTILLFLIVLAVCPFIGPTTLAYGKVFLTWPPAPDNQDAQVFFSVRLPRELLAALAGAAMACAGVVFQAVLRNPLACPFTLGVAGGSSFGAVLAILLGWTTTVHGFSFITFFSFLGAILSLFLVHSMASGLRSYSTVTFLLAGVAVNYFFNALVLLGYYIADFTQAYAMIHWMIGSLDMVEMATVGRLASWLFLGFLTLLAQARGLNLLSAGEEWARVKGVRTDLLIGASLGMASLMTSAVVALTGPIAFVGLIVPHIYRLWIGNDHRYLMPCATLGGAAFLMVCDTVARSFFGPTEVPVGVLTALLGVPVLLWLLFNRKPMKGI